eukprot:547057-Prymnesium_polylepis.1
MQPAVRYRSCCAARSCPSTRSSSPSPSSPSVTSEGAARPADGGGSSRDASGTASMSSTATSSIALSSSGSNGHSDPGSTKMTRHAKCGSAPQMAPIACSAARLGRAHGCGARMKHTPQSARAAA